MWHADIKDREVGNTLSTQVNGYLAITRRADDFVAEILQNGAQSCCNQVLVICNEDSLGSRRR